MADSSYSPLDSDETLGDGPSVGSRAAHVKSSSALQEYGPRPLAYMLDYYYGLEENGACGRLLRIKKNAQLFFLSALLLIFLPHTLISFIFMYSTGQPMPLLLLLAPLVLCRKQSSSVLTGCIVIVYAFWHDFGFFASVLSLLFENFPRTLWLCMPLQAKLYSAAMTIVQITTILVILRFSVSRVPRRDPAILQRNWLRARAGVLVIASCFFFMCCLDAARLGHPFSSTAAAMTNISFVSVATNIRSFAALSACAISNDGRLFCSDNEFRLDSNGIVSVFDVIGMHDFNGADSAYGFGAQMFMPNYGSVVHVSVGGTHVCAVASGAYLADRQVWKNLWYWPWFMRDRVMWNHPNYSAVACWGYNDHGQLGTGVATDALDRKYGTLREYSETPDEVTLLSQSSRRSAINEKVYQPSLLLPHDTVVHLETGHCHTCALTSLRSLFCWGCNTFGQVGSPLHCPDKSMCGSPAAVSFSHMNVTLPVSITAAADNTCAIMGPHDVVVCWGRNNQAQLGRSAEVPGNLYAPVDDNSSHAHSDYPWFVDGLPGGAVRLALGREHACASFADGMLRCWGSNQWGQLGESACGADSKCRRPVVVHLRTSSAAAPLVLISICAGNRITCGLADSRLHCLGAFVNQSFSNISLAHNDSLSEGLHISDNAVTVACSVNDRSPRFGLTRPRPERDELDEYSGSVSISKYAVNSMGLVEGICVKNVSGHVSCIQGQFCNENGDSCLNGSLVVASVAQHERLVVDVEVGILLFLGYIWHLVFYYRYFLSVLLKCMFSSQASSSKEPDDIQSIELEQYRDCSAHMESMGFPPDVARQAAAATGGDLQAAVAWVLAHPGAPYEDVLHFLGLSVIEKVGQGGFGSVYKCSSALERGRSIAVKVISYAINSKDAQHATREGQRLANCDHENIVRMYKVHQPPNFPGICVLEMEFVAGGDLHRHLKTARLPHDCVLRFTRQLLNALVYLHHSKQLLHGDIKPHNILIESASPHIDGSPADHSQSVLKLADFGLAKNFAAADSNDSTTRAGAGTEWYMSSEALRGQPRCYADDIWSACLVILEMDTGMPLQQLMQGPGSVRINELLIKASPELLPVLYSVLLGNESSRFRSACDLLRHLDICTEAIFEWQMFNGLQFVAVSAAAAFVLENAFTTGASRATLHLPPPLDLEFDIRAVCDAADGLGTQTHAHSGGQPHPIRRMLRPHVNSIPVWQQIIRGKGWQQCSAQLCAMLEFEFRITGRATVAALSRRLLIQRNTIGPVMIPFPLQREPYCVTLVSNGAISHPSASPADIDALAAQVHESLPEFDITCLEAVVNQTLECKYAAYRQRIAVRCNGNPNERFLFHFCPESIIPKIWQEGEGHDPRLSQWAEVGKGAYFSEHVIYGYAYKFNLWEGGAEPAIGESFRVFVSLIALGKCKDLGVGCGTCTSPEWEEWKAENAPMKIENPTRPPAFALPPDAGRRKHMLDLMGVKDSPRYDSVMSTEGNLGTSPASTYMNNARTHLVRDVMHPRLLQRPRDWGSQYVVFETSASYPMYILTLTKQRDSPVATALRSH